MIRFDCKTSGKSVNISKCRLRPLNSTSNKIEVDVQIFKTIRKPLVSFLDNLIKNYNDQNS